MAMIFLKSGPGRCDRAGSVHMERVKRRYAAASRSSFAGTASTRGPKLVMWVSVAL